MSDFVSALKENLRVGFIVFALKENVSDLVSALTENVSDLMSALKEGVSDLDCLH